MGLVRVLVSGVAATVAWWLGLLVVFGPAQAILSDPQRQSAKFLAVFSEEPLPRMAAQPLILFAGLFVIGLIYAAVYSWLEPKLDGPRYRKGLMFGVVAWAIMVPWFEFYLPWNVMLEPLPLVVVEVVCWFVVMLLVGLAVSLVHGLFGRKQPATR